MSAKSGLPVESANEGGRSQIVVVNRQRGIAVDVLALRVFAERALSEVMKLPAAAVLPQEINVVLVADRRIRRIHQDFMGLDSSTDVITFQHGDIVLSVETARRQATQYRSNLTHEVQLYVIHGLLHLCGYDDRTAAGRGEMNRLQEEMLGRLTATVRSPRGGRCR